MKPLIKFLFVTTLALPPLTGLVAVLSGFGDPWGMGSKDPVGIFITAALPILPPGLYQLLAWPLTYGVGLLLAPLALLKRRSYYLLAVLVYIAAIGGGWILGWILSPDRVDVLLDGISYMPGCLNSNLWKFGIYLLTDAFVLATTASWWSWRRSPHKI
jgi:hypothetical protein